MFGFLQDRDTEQEGGTGPTTAPAGPASDANANAGGDAESGNEGAEGDLMQAAGQWLGDWGRGIDQEGFSAIFDPFGAVDRQDAQRELADRFQVVDDTEGRSAENQVSAEEYQQIARTYSNIRMGRSDIQFNTEGLEEDEAGAFRGGMMNDLASIMQTEGGRTMVNRLSNNEKEHTTTLSPLYHKNDEGEYDSSLGRDYSNGFAKADNISDAYRVDEDTPNVGTNSRVRMNPGTEISPDSDASMDRWLPWRSDVLLYHELIHSMDHTYGTMDKTKTGMDADGVTNTEGEPYDTPWDAKVKRREHRAVGIGQYEDEEISENAYRSARRDIGASNHGERAGDDNMAHRDTYNRHESNWPELYGEPNEGWEREHEHH